MLDLGGRQSIYQPEQEGLIFPERPENLSLEEERKYRRERLVAACRAFAIQKFDYGFAGHLTVRDPEYLELYWTNPMCVPFDKVKLSNLILVDHDGKVIEGEYAVNRAGFVLHANVHEEHPTAFAGVKAALHQNHGLLTASRHSIDAAAFWFIALERCCQQQLDIAASGIDPIYIPPERARYSREHVGSEYIGWLHFQTIWNQLVEDAPDMFD